MQLQTWKIWGRAFHFGEHGIGQEASRLTWPSDSLYAAILARLAALQGGEAVEAWVGTEDAPKAPPFLLTSTFPYAKDARFFPVPLAALRVSGDLPDGWRSKDLKKVRFVSEGVYRRLLQGETLADVADNVIPVHGKTVWVLKSEEVALPVQKDEQGKKVLPVGERRFWTIEKRPRVAVGRAPNNSNLFHVGAVRFADECGLWFGVQWLTDDAGTQALLTALLAELGDAGLGAERSSGYGQAKIEKDALLEFSAPAGGAWTTLSRYLPAGDEIPALQSNLAAYQMVRLGGWMDGRGLRRRAATLLAEGAVLGPLDKPAPWGSAVDLHPHPGENDDFAEPEHPVWRLGWAVAVGYGDAQ
ncbi:MAG: hypothetical protein Fur0018_22160 [Anaerolineales bacterium]